MHKQEGSNNKRDHITLTRYDERFIWSTSYCNKKWTNDWMCETMALKQTTKKPHPIDIWHHPQIPFLIEMKWNALCFESRRSDSAIYKPLSTYTYQNPKSFLPLFKLFSTIDNNRFLVYISIFQKCWKMSRLNFALQSKSNNIFLSGFILHFIHNTYSTHTEQNATQRQQSE